MKKNILLTIALGLFGFGLQAQISTFPWNEDFESQNQCPTGCSSACPLSGSGFSNDLGDQYDWIVDVGGTGSSNTGPGGFSGQGTDHNPGTAQGKYLYTESSGCANSSSNLVSPMFDFTNVSTPAVTFWYHMYGNTMGTMQFDVESGGVWTLNVIPGWTDNVNLWQEQTVDLAAYGGMNNIRFRVRGTRGYSFGSDMAVDDFSVFNATYQIIPIALVDPSCPGDTDGSIEVDALFGTPPFTYAWSNGSTGTLLTGLGGGTYCGTVTDANGDTTSTCYVLTEGDSVSVATNISQTRICKYDVFTAQAIGSGGNGGEAYTWDTTVANYSWDTSGVPTVVPMTNNSVSSAQSIGFDFVFFGDTFNEFLIGANGFISFNPTSPTGCCDGDPIPNANINEPRNAIYAMWDYHTATASVYSYFVTGIAPQRKLVMSFENLPVCCGASPNRGSVQVVLHETSNCIEINQEFALPPTFGSQTQGIQNADGTVAFAYPGRNGTLWQAAGNTHISFCPTDSLGLSYNWSNGVVGPNAINFPIGTYTVTVTDQNGCEGTAALTVDPAVSELTLNPSISDISCHGFNDGMIESDQTGGISPINYTWSSGQTSADITALSQGTFDVVAEDAVGCLDSVSEMVIAEPDLLVSSVYSLEQTQCPEDENGSISIVISGGVAPYNVLWSDGQIGPMATNLPAGNYQAQITDASGCLSIQSASILAEFNSPSVDLGANITQPNGAAATLNAGPQTGYLWSTGATSQIVQVSATGAYWVEVYNGNGCAASDSIYVEIWPTGINDIADDSKFSLYPNPATSSLMLKLEGSESFSDVRVNILNVQGQIVSETMLTSISSSEQVELNVQELAPGMYNLSIQSESFKAVKSFVKQ